MTLKEKLKDRMYYNYNHLELAEECEKIADDFAIEFADWIRVCKLKCRPYDFDNIKELLEIYKDEKGL